LTDEISPSKGEIISVDLLTWLFVFWLFGCVFS